MENEIIFSETQRFKQWWIWLLLVGINALSIYGVFHQVIGGQPFGDKPMSNSALMIMTGTILLVTAIFSMLKLETQIKQDGIYVRFFPFHLKFKYFNWNVISNYYVRQYKPIKEYGGWGIRYGFFGKGKALNISGKDGLQLEFFDGKKLLIGTQRAKELEKLLPKKKERQK